ncbi:MAG: ATP-dependent zinc protease [Bacteriovoracia bacterium]
MKIGWREWVGFPDLGIPCIKAKVDTGARTSALHAHGIELFTQKGVLKVRFQVYALQRKTTREVACVAKVIEHRVVANSGGQREERVVIRTRLHMGARDWPIELTLTNRSTMNFRLLLGRTALSQRCLISPASSYLLGKPPRKFSGEKSRKRRTSGSSVHK